MERGGEGIGRLGWRGERGGGGGGPTMVETGGETRIGEEVVVEEETIGEVEGRGDGVGKERVCRA